MLTHIYSRLLNRSFNLACDKAIDGANNTVEFACKYHVALHEKVVHERKSERPRNKLIGAKVKILYGLDNYAGGFAANSLSAIISSNYLARARVEFLIGKNHKPPSGCIILKLANSMARN